MANCKESCILYGGPYVQFTKQVLSAKVVSIIHNQNEIWSQCKINLISMQNEFDLNAKSKWSQCKINLISMQNQNDLNAI